MGRTQPGAGLLRYDRAAFMSAITTHTGIHKPNVSTDKIKCNPCDVLYDRR